MRYLRTALFAAMTFSAASSAAEAIRPPVDGFILRIVSDAVERSREIFIGSADLQGLEQNLVTVQGKPEDPVRTLTGVRLESVFRLHGVESTAIRRLSVTAADGYMAVIEGELLSGLGTGFCATGIDGERVFPEKYGYMRLIFPDLRPMYWINNPVKIEVFLGDPEPIASILDLYFPESAPLKPLLAEKRIIPLADLLAGAGADPDKFSVLAADTLLRPYDSNTIIKYMVLLAEGDGEYSVGGVNVPTGLKTKGVFFITSGNSMLFLKQFTAAERDMWSDVVWSGRAPMEGGMTPLVLRMLKNGRTILERSVSGTGTDVYDCAIGMIMQHPEFDCIRVTGK